jgi:FtsP/CotA-like multicopper oxidase with cupredoxin domain
MSNPLLLLLGCAVLVHCAVVEHHLTVQRGLWRVAKAAANASVVLVNGQFPAPTIEAVVGDDVVVHVQNALSQGTAVHFHGLLQLGTPHMDGVPFGTHCLIAPGANFTYRFKADAAGTFWYHAHVEAHCVYCARGARQRVAAAAERLVSLTARPTK